MASGHKVSKEGERLVTPGGACFRAPRGWVLRRSARALVLEPPGGDAELAILEGLAARTAGDAVDAAWAMFRPGTAGRRPLVIMPRAANRNGWGERTVFEFETSPKEWCRVEARAFERPDDRTWTVVLLTGSQATLEKRTGQLSLILQSLRPRSWSRESFRGRCARSLDAPRLEQLVAFVELGMERLGIPGVALAVVQKERVVLSRGLGVRRLGGTEPVTDRTLFLVASNTKALTTLLLARLVDLRRFRWSDLVRRREPSFRLGNSRMTSRVRFEDLVSACTGLPRQDLEWIFNPRNAGPTSTFELLRSSRPTTKFGEVFQYSNLLAASAGYVAADLAMPGVQRGAHFEHAMRAELLGPLGMEDSTFDFAAAEAGDHAHPHGVDSSSKTTVADPAINRTVAALCPAGGLWTSARDLIRFVQLELSQGRLPNGDRLVSKRNLLRRRKGRMLFGEDSRYGMGLIESRRCGVRVINHGGSMFGYKSDFVFLPRHGVGAVLLTNSDTGLHLLAPFIRRLLELLFDGRPEAEGDLEANALRHFARLESERALWETPTPGILQDLLPWGSGSRFVNSALGTLSASLEGAQLVFDFGGWKSVVLPRRAYPDGTRSWVTVSPGRRGFEFELGTEGGTPSLTLRDAQHEYVYSLSP